MNRTLDKIQNEEYSQASQRNFDIIPLAKVSLITLLDVEEGAMYYFLLNNRFLKRAMGKGPCHAVVV